MRRREEEESRTKEKYMKMLEDQRKKGEESWRIEVVEVG